MKVFGATVLFLLMSFSVTFAQTDWKQQKDKNGIVVYTKQNGTSKLKSSKATMTVATTIDRILEVLADIPNYVEWTPKTKSAKLIKKISKDEFYYYTVIKAPMVTDRDLVVHSKVTKNANGETVVTMTGVPDYLPEEEGLVRMPQYKGTYILKDVGNGKVKITLEYSSDPGGSLPEWLVNTAAVDVPYDIFSNLKELF